MATQSTDTNEVELSRQLWVTSADAWLARVDEDLNRTALLDPVMLDLAGDPCDALDVGCGEGRFCRILSDRGFHTVGVDPTLPLLDRAKETHLEGEYVEAWGESLPFEDNMFGLVISYLALLDIPDFRAAIAEMARVTRPGGRILVANCTPLYTSLAEPWQRDEEGKKLHIRVDDYMSEHSVRAQWCGIDILNYHRPLSAYFAAFLSHGLRLEAYLEPLATPEVLEQHPRMADNFRAPNFFVMAWRKE